jgi:hypothetical protein
VPSIWTASPTSPVSSSWTTLSCAWIRQQVCQTSFVVRTTLARPNLTSLPGVYHDDVGGSGNAITGVYTAPDGTVQTVTGVTAEPTTTTASSATIDSGSATASTTRASTSQTAAESASSRSSSASGTSSQSSSSSTSTSQSASAAAQTGAAARQAIGQVGLMAVAAMLAVLAAM